MSKFFEYRKVPAVTKIDPVIIAMDELNFEIIVPIIDPIPMNAVNFNKDKPTSIFSNWYRVDPERGITTITIIRLHPKKKCVIEVNKNVLEYISSFGIKSCPYNFIFIISTIVKINKIEIKIISKNPRLLNSEIKTVNKISINEIISVSINFIFTTLIEVFGIVKINAMTKNDNGKFI